MLKRRRCLGLLGIVLGLKITILLVILGKREIIFYLVE